MLRVSCTADSDNVCLDTKPTLEKRFTFDLNCEVPTNRNMVDMHALLSEKIDEFNKR